ncbi:MAG: RDD family protein [Dysgonomonas sp.]
MNIEVQTTQNVTIDYETASVGNRILAYIIDWVVIIIWYLGWAGMISLIGESIFSIFSDNGLMIFFVIVITVPILFYDLLMETYNHGQSIGKMIVKIRVVPVGGINYQIKR